MMSLQKLKIYRRLCFFLLIAPTLSSLNATASDAPEVLVTIKPLQLIAQAITKDVSNAEVLLPPGASPHNHSMKPSDARKISSADVIFWIGPDMESFLTKRFSNLKGTIVIPMMDSKGIKLRTNFSNTSDVHEHSSHERNSHERNSHERNSHERNSHERNSHERNSHERNSHERNSHERNSHERNSHERKKHERKKHDQHDHGQYDPHIWLSTDNGRTIARTMAATLIEADKANAEHYKKNLDYFLISMDETDARNRQKLSQIEQQSFFVFHDAYGYLQEQYQLNIAGHFTLNPEQQPGMKHLGELRNKLKSAGKTCIFREPQFQPAYLNRITEDLPVKIGILDPLADDIANQPDGFALFIDSLIDNIVQCLNR